MRNHHLDDFDLPEDQDESAWGVIRRFWWNPSIVEDEGVVRLFAGNQVLAEFETMRELRAFVSGMATVHLSQPEEAVIEMTRVLGVEAEWNDFPEWWTGRNLP